MLQTSAMILTRHILTCIKLTDPTSLPRTGVAHASLAGKAAASRNEISSWKLGTTSMRCLGRTLIKI
jgi:hypothetical protein